MNLLNSFLIHNYVSLRTSIDPNQNGKAIISILKLQLKQKITFSAKKLLKNQNNVNLFLF
jgi:hypothetical protein